MALFTTDIDLKGDNSKVESYLLRLKRDLEYMFSHLNPEDNFDEDAKLLYVANQERQSAIEIALDHITLEMVDKDNIVAAINLSDEGVKIQGEKLSLEGVTTFNNNVVIGLDGTIHANNGEFSGYIAASDISGSNITGSKITAGGNDDSGITVKDKDGNVIGTWNKAGLTITKGDIKGTKLELGGLDNTNGTLTVKNASGTTIGIWNNDGITITNGALSVTGGGTISGSTITGGTINGSTINVGGNGVGGAINVKNASGTTIGRLAPGEISFTNGTITGGTINGATVNVGGSGVSGAINVKDSSGNILGSFTPSGITLNGGQINAGTINGSTINVGGSGVAGSINIKTSTGTVLGTLSPSGITMNGGRFNGSTIHLGGNGQTGELVVSTSNNIEIGRLDRDGITVGQFFSDATSTWIGPFVIAPDPVIGEETYHLATEDDSFGISADPSNNDNLWIWAGKTGAGLANYDFVVNTDGEVWAKDVCVIGETKTLLEIIRDISDIYDDLNAITGRVGDIEDYLGL